MQYPTVENRLSPAVALPELSDSPFTVTYTVSDGGKTIRASKHLSGCSNPTFIDSYYRVFRDSTSVGGSMSCSVGTVLPGGTARCEIKVDTGYALALDAAKLTGGTADGIQCTTGIGGGVFCQISNITSDVTVRYEFKLLQYSVTGIAIPPEGGEVECGPNPVEYGRNVTCTASPKEGYSYTPGSMKRVSGIVGDTKCTGASCTFRSVTSDLRVQAEFTLNKYTVTDTTPTGAGGKMNCTSPVEHGKSTTCTAAPEEGYHFTSATHSGKASMDTCPGGVCTLSNVTGNVTVTGKFTLNEYTVTGAADPAAGGTLACSSPVEHGKDTTCTVSTNTGYSFDKTATSLAPAGKATATCTDTECEVSGVKDNITVTGKFTLNQYTVTGVPSTGGTMNCTPATATYFDTITCTPTADHGYAFDKAADITPTGKATVTCTDTECSVSGVTDDVSVAGVFKLLPPPGSAAAVPTLGGVCMALSSLALAGAAVPALQRRRKRGEKADTRL